MKISKLFHWLYAILMFLPFVSVLSFTLYYAFNKNADIPTVTENVSKEVDFNQLVSNIHNKDFSEVSNFDIIFNINVNENDIYYFRFVPSVDNNINDFRYYQFYSTSDVGIYYDIRSDLYTFTSSGQLYVQYSRYLNGDVQIDYNGSINVFNLTQMFGSGNEPTIQEFNNWFSDNYYDYTLSQHLVIDNYDTKTVTDSPINHIWLPSFGGMGWTIKNVFTFLITTMFGISVANGIGYTVLYLLTYWLCISLIWLIYDVIMYVPLLVHRWLDKGVVS